MIGKVFERLTVTAFSHVRSGHRLYVCTCACGNEVTVLGHALRSGNTRSCGCLMRETSRRNGVRNATHGQTLTPTYYTWKSMIQRCTNPKHDAYDRYGGRGITICERWHRFENFLADMGEKPAGLTLDRVDNDSHYEPSNCRWATRSQQNSNQRRRNSAAKAD